MKHKRLILTAAMVVLLSTATVGTVFAETESKINSKGTIVCGGSDGSEGAIFDSADFKTLANEIDVVSNKSVRSKLYTVDVDVSDSINASNGEYFGQIPISSCKGYDSNIEPFAYIPLSCYAELDSRIQGKIMRSTVNINVCGGVSSTYHCQVLALYYEE